MKYSRQREAIYEFLKTRTDHPTAEFIYESLKEDMPNISLGTVYRNLSLLSEHKVIQRLTGNGTSDRFDPNPVSHYHFCCDNCGCVEDIPMTSMDSLNQLAQAYLSGKISSHTLTFHGLCENCVEKDEKDDLVQAAIHPTH